MRLHGHGGRPPTRRVRRRQRSVSHWPPTPSPRVAELLGGLAPRQLTRAQREDIVVLLIVRDADEPAVRAAVRSVVAGGPPPVPPAPKRSPLLAAWRRWADLETERAREERARTSEQPPTR